MATGDSPDVREPRERDPEEMDRELREALEEDGHRFTTQRAAVYRTLAVSRTHPTADEIFTDVRERIPDISLATVYKALEAFVSAGVARKLTIGEGPARYDGRTEEHEHVRCLSCGRVADVDDLRVADRFEGLEGATDYEVLDYRLELLGHCPRCRN